MSTPLKVEFRIGEIEFKAEGEPADVEQQRESFVNTLLPLAVDAMVRTRASNAVQATNYIEEKEQNLLSTSQYLEENVQSSMNCTNSEIPLSINEFLTERGFVSQIDLAIGLIYYNEKTAGCANFSTEDLKQYFRNAKEKVPSNASDVVNKLMSKAYIMLTDEKGKYQLTRTGEAFVTNFSISEKKGKKPKTRKASSKVDSIYAHLNADSMNLKGYPEITTSMDFIDQMLLVMHIVTSEGHGDSFSAADVQCLMTGKLGLRATNDQINGVFTRKKKWFESFKDEKNSKIVRRRLLMEAKEYAQSVIDKYSVKE